MNSRHLIGLAAALTIGAAGLAAQPGPGQRGRGSGMDPFAFGGQSMARMARFLELTEEQRQGARKVFQAAREETRKLTPQVRENQLAIRELTSRSPQEFEAGIQALAATQASLMAEMMVIRHRATNQFLNLLTPEQREKAQQLQQRRMRQRGPRPGPAPGKG